eukprot:31372-Pelagomonas_calceolata.AAC.1
MEIPCSTTAVQKTNFAPLDRYAASHRHGHIKKKERTSRTKKCVGSMPLATRFPPWFPGPKANLSK